MRLKIKKMRYIIFLINYLNRMLFLGIIIASFFCLAKADDDIHSTDTNTLVTRENSLTTKIEEINRESLFTAVYQRYLMLAVQSYVGILNQLNQTEKEYLESILHTAKFYTSTAEIPLKFTRNKAIFDMKDGTPLTIDLMSEVRSTPPRPPLGLHCKKLFN